PAAVTLAAPACGTTTAPNSGVSAKFTVSARTASAAPAATRPERAPSETIPAGARAVTVALVTGLPRFPAGRYSCPLDGGARLVLTFRAAPGGPASAVATVALEGCE